MSEQLKHEVNNNTVDKAILGSIFSSADTLDEAYGKAEEAGIEFQYEALEAHVHDLVKDANKITAQLEAMKKQIAASQQEGALEVSNEVVRLKNYIANYEEKLTEKVPSAKEIAELEEKVQELKNRLQEKESEQPTGWLKLNPFGDKKRKEFEDEKKLYIESLTQGIRTAEHRLESANQECISHENQKMKLVSFKKQLEELLTSSDAATHAEQRLNQDATVLNTEADALRSELVHTYLLLALGTVKSPEAHMIQEGLQKKDLQSLVGEIKSNLAELKLRFE